MLQTLRKEISFVFKDKAILSSNLTIRNQLPNTHISFKIKATTPDYFQVNPSKGILQPGQSKAIEFKTNRILTLSDAKTLAVRQKFLIQTIQLPEIKKPEEVEQLWVMCKSDPTKVENIRLKLKIQGTEDIKAKMKSVFGSGIKLRSSEMYEEAQAQEIHMKPTPYESDQDTKPQNPKYQLVFACLNQDKCQQERQQQFKSIVTRRQSKSKPLLSKILMFLLVFLSGFILSRLIFHHRQESSRIIITHTPQPIILQPENNDGTTKQSQVKKLKSPGPQRIIITDQNNQKVILVNDNPGEPIRLVVKTTTLADGTQKVIIS